MTEQLRLLSVGAHPADVFDQSGGTMAHHAGRGDYVACAVITHGARVHDAVISEEMSHRDEVPEADQLSSMIAERSDVKAEEVRAAGSILGFKDIHFLGGDDAVLLVTESVVQQLARIIREIRPDIILTHYPKVSGGLTSPHAIAGQIALFAMQHAGGVDPGDRKPAAPGCLGLLLRLRHCGCPQGPVGLGGRLHERHLRRYHRRCGQEARGVGHPGQPGL